MSDEETIAVPKKATEAMVKVGAEFAMQAGLSSDYPWPVYMSDLWAVMVANAPAAPKPDPSPVCVEVRGNSQTFEQWWLHHVMPDGYLPYEWASSVGIGVIAERAFNAGRRTLELVNARTVEGVEAECSDLSYSIIHEGEVLATGASPIELAANVKAALTEARAQGAVEERESLMSLALGSEADNYAHYDGHVAEWLRTLTEGTTP